MLVDSDDDDGNGEEEAMSSSAKQEVLALVNGSSVRAPYLNCLMEGEPWCLLQPLPAGRKEFLFSGSLAPAEMLLLCALCR